MKRGRATRAVARAGLAGVGVWMGTWLVALLGSAQAGEVAPLPSFEGKHAVATSSPARGARLLLASGFAIAWPPGVAGLSQPAVSLRIAKRRVQAREVTEGFVPIGPSVVFDAQVGAEGPLLRVSFEAKRFALRRGHRAVLAIERGAACPPENEEGAEPCGPFRLQPADLDTNVGQLFARVRSLPGLRLQFGSVPELPGDTL